MISTSPVKRGSNQVLTSWPPIKTYSTVDSSSSRSEKPAKTFFNLGHADTTVTRTVYAHAFNRTEGSPVADEFAAAIFRTMETASKI